MNTVQISPLGSTAPPASSGKDPGAADASQAHKPKAKPQPELTAPEAVADQHLAEARANFASAAEERKAKAEKARAEKAAKEAAEARKRAEEAAVQLDIGGLQREVGLVEGTTKVFVDLVDPLRKQAVVRVFGPSEDNESTEAPADSGQTRPAANAYAPAGAAQPLKDLGVA